MRVRLEGYGSGLDFFCRSAVRNVGTHQSHRVKSNCLESLFKTLDG